MNVIKYQDGTEKLVREDGLLGNFTVANTMNEFIRLEGVFLNSDSVHQLRDHLTAWLETDSFKIKSERTA
jgi:hypothetical protein